jgi:hypothetical protein
MHPSPNFINFRQVAEGSNLPFYRSGSFALLNEQDYKHFKHLKIKYYYDLRMDIEITSQAGANRFDKFDVENVHLAIDIGSDSFLQLGIPTIHDECSFYLRILPDALKRLHSMAEHFVMKYAENKNICVVFGCSFGRDRTGLISALLLKVLGFSEEFILRDYLLSEKYILHSMDYFIKRYKPPSMSKEDYISHLQPKKEIINYVLDYLQQNQEMFYEYSNSPIFVKLHKLMSQNIDQDTCHR